VNSTPNLEDALRLVARVLDETDLPYALIGGMAVILRGHDRTTQDIDAVVLGLDEQLEPFLALAERQGLVFRLPNGLQFARQNRVVLLKAPDGTAIDVSMGFLPFEMEVAARATRFEIGENLQIPVASVEDLVIMKLIAARTRDYEDVDRLIELYPSLDRIRIRETVSEYAELLESPDIMIQTNKHLG